MALVERVSGTSKLLKQFKKILFRILGSQTLEKDSGRRAPPQTATGREKAPTGRKIALPPFREINDIFFNLRNTNGANKLKKCVHVME